MNDLREMLKSIKGKEINEHGYLDFVRLAQNLIKSDIQPKFGVPDVAELAVDERSNYNPWNMTLRRCVKDFDNFPLVAIDLRDTDEGKTCWMWFYDVDSAQEILDNEEDHKEILFSMVFNLTAENDSDFVLWCQMPQMNKMCLQLSELKHAGGLTELQRNAAC